jgi:hypothetical protein
MHALVGDREIDALTLVARVNTAGQIARQLRVTKRTLISTSSSACVKLRDEIHTEPR